MRRAALFASSVLIACASASPDGSGERTGTATQPFSSREAVLVDFAFDGRLFADTADPAAVRRLIDAQLMYSVGQLNGDRSVGRHERLEISGIQTAAAAGGGYEIGYRAKLPVAWGGDEAPSRYVLKLPARIAEADQIEFTRKYGTRCVDPEGGDLNANERVDSGRMFLFYRPEREGCTIAPEDIVTMPASVTMSPENTYDKYPEYHRIWEDGALHVVAIFGIEIEGQTRDAGIGAYQDFLDDAAEYLASRQPDAKKRSRTTDDRDGRRRARVAATLPDGRAVRIEAMLVRPRLDTDDALDPWYDARSADADIIFYSGHAGHGENVRLLMQKGTFRPGKYLMWIVNGCDTFAYIDPTLAQRRAKLNPDDPSGTKHMDTISNVLGNWFRTGDETAMKFLRDVVSAGDANAKPKTYPELFDGIDPDQVIVVTGEEDNEFDPRTAAPPKRIPAPDAPPEPAPGDDAEGVGGSGGRGKSGCAVGLARRGLGGAGNGAAVLGLGGVLLVLARRRLREPPAESA
jgi:hypothetical protein